MGTLTTAAINRLRTGALRCDRVRGLEIRSRRGQRYWSYRYTLDGRRPRVTIGSYPEISLADARRIAAEIARRVAAGEDPASERDTRREAPTVNDMLDRALREHWDVHAKASTRKKVEANLRLHVRPKFGTRKVSSVTHQQVSMWHQELGKKTPGAANRTLAYLAKAFSEAQRWGWVSSNPCHGVRKFKEKRVERYLSDEELGRLRAATGRLYSQGFHEPALAFVWVLLLTGMRSGEALGLRWSDIDEGRRQIHLRDSKTGARTLVISDEALTILQGLDRPGEWVFYSKRDPLGPIQHPWGFWRVIRKAAGLEDVRIHDLRHTHASRLVRAGVHVSVIQAILGHSNITTSARYMHVEREQEARALSDVAKMLGQ